MEYISFSENDDFSVALLIKESALKENLLEYYYLDFLEKYNVDISNFVAIGCPYNSNNKVSNTEIKVFYADLLPQLVSQDIQTIIIADSAYFKVLTNSRKAEGFYGTTLKCVIPGFEHIDVLLLPNYQAILHNPAIEPKIQVCLKHIVKHLGTTVTQFQDEPEINVTVLNTLDEIVAGLQSYFNEPKLAVDIEAYSLEFHEAGIATIAFAKSKTEAIAFSCDLQQIKHETHYHEFCPNYDVRETLLDFFTHYEGELVFHNAPYDLSVLIFVLYMKEQLGHIPGMLEGIRAFQHNVIDTKLITYLATNNTVKNSLGLKENVLEYLGNYALEDDIDDIRVIPVSKLLQYNGKDTAGTYYLYEKNMPVLIQDNQESVHDTIFRPSIALVTQMNLVGMPLNRKQTFKVHRKLKAIRKNLYKEIQKNDVIKLFTEELQWIEHDKKHADWKNKTAPFSHFSYVKYNPNSSSQTQNLLYTFCELPVLDLNKSKKPSVKAKHIKKLINHTDDQKIKNMVQLLCDYADVKILIQNFTSKFITKMVKHIDGHWYLHGNFVLGGTKSGRMSSKSPNMQNIPSAGNPYAKLIKSCFEAPPGWIMVGADFASLEDRISALTTKDPNKLKVYTDGYDGHCLRAYYYYSDEMPDIDPNSVESINSIEHLYKSHRKESKAPTFALTYLGTHYTLMNNCGFPKEKAIRIYEAFHTMYSKSDEWVEERIQFAAKHGYIDIAFGLRLRTPTLKNCVYGSKSMPYEAVAESRTVGNACGQSYGMLNNRAGIAVQEQTLNSKYAEFVLPIAHIHDAQYFIVLECPEVITWTNKVVTTEMFWQELPEIQHDEVTLGGNLDIFYPNWAYHVTLPLDVSSDQIETIVNNHVEEIYEELN